MTDITQCPQCGTHYKITPEQSRSHKGMVRCGHCKTVFNAVEHRYTEPAQLDLPLVLDDIADVTGLHQVYNPYSTNDQFSANDQFSLSQSYSTISPEAAARLANDFSHLPDVHLQPTVKPPSPRQTFLLKLGIVLLGLVLLLQILYLLRVEIAARLPGAKLGLTRICAVLKCTIPLPQKIDLLSIESSEMETDPTQANIITLHALLRSRAPYALAYPNIELTLTDAQENPLARRTFAPADYISASDDEQRGLAANREANIKLHLNTTDLKPAAGYRLFLYYPQ